MGATKSKSRSTSQSVDGVVVNAEKKIEEVTKSKPESIHTIESVDGVVVDAVEKVDTKSKPESIHTIESVDGDVVDAEEKIEEAKHIFVPAYPYVPGPEHGILSPFDPSSRVLPQGYQIGPRFKPLSVDIRFEKDVAVTLRDGVKIYVDVFRPVTDQPVPVIMAWSPYGKSAGTAPRTTGLYDLLGINNSMLSGLARFEGPDPSYWCANGYAVCNPDPRGIAFSEGNIWMIGRQEAKDCYDLIEWLGVQTWCNAKVGMSGTSYLGWAQYFAAAECPPHLAAINPCEGLGDAFRDLTTQGGMPDLAFLQRLQVNHVGSGLREDVNAEALAYPKANNEIWTDKIPRWQKIEVPCYLVASYSNTLHSRGTFRGWRRIPSENKWIRIHNSMEWPDYYSNASTEDLRSFFDHYLRGVVNAWESTPRVRYSLHDFRGDDRINQAADQFPPVDVSYQKFYLDGKFRKLSTQQIVADNAVTYDTQAYPAFASFTVSFTQETILVGYPKVHLWVEAKAADDMDLFIMVQKLDKFGNHLQQFVIPNQSAIIQDFTENGASILRYKGPHGRLRVSARRLKTNESTDEIPVHKFSKLEKLQPAQIVEVDIDLLPVGVVFYPSEQLRLVISSKNEMGAMMPLVAPFVPQNQGQHVIHTGGGRPSYLQLPVKSAP